MVGLLHVPSLSNSNPHLKLGYHSELELEGQFIALMGFPQFENPKEKIWRDNFPDRSRLQIQLGETTGTRPLGISKPKLFSTHDCMNCTGNIGSPVVNLTTGECVGVHVAGEYLNFGYFATTFQLLENREFEKALWNR